MHFMALLVALADEDLSHEVKIKTYFVMIAYRVWGRDSHAQNKYLFVCQLAKPNWWESNCRLLQFQELCKFLYCW